MSEQNRALFDRLWAPWRLAYIKGDVAEAQATKNTEAEATKAAAQRPASLLAGGDPSCFICRGVVETTDRENLVVTRSQHAVVILNRFPYNNGHLLVAPQRHLGRLDQIEAEVHAECIALISRMVSVLERTIRAEGFNIGLNLGHIAGAGLPGHLHWHIVPRWNGDVNFMPVLAGVKVIPQSLDALWEIVTTALAEEAS